MGPRSAEERTKTSGLDPGPRGASTFGNLLERGDEFYRSVLDSLSEGVLITDTASRILYANRQMEALTGWKPEELVGRVSYELLAPQELWPTMRQRLDDRLAGKAETYENELVRKDGSRHWILVRASPFRDDNGAVQGTIGAFGCIQRQKELQQENHRLLDVLAVERGFADLVGHGPALGKVVEQIRMVAPTEATVLILGESGTGKELVARAIHQASRRSEQPLVRVNCASIPHELFESEFFGHVKGAFTGAVKDRTGRFELAHGGTLFLDEVGEIPLELQAKLLRVLQEGTFERVGEERTRKVDVRILAATNRDLQVEARQGRFRQDLYSRLSVFPVHLPPLRERREDIRPLVEHFLRDSARRLGVRPGSVRPADWQRLEGYSWPGNIRELQNVIERGVILARGGELHLAALLPAEEPRLAGNEVSPAGDPAAAPAGSPLQLLKDQEREVVRAALEASGGRIYGPDGAAARLGVRPTTLASRIARWGWMHERPGRPKAK